MGESPGLGVATLPLTPNARECVLRKLTHVLRCGAVSMLGAACAKHAPSSGAVQSDPSACEAVRPFLDSTWRNSRAPGISLGIALPDGRSCGIAVGWADTAKKEPLRPQSLLLTGSVGKTYVAATVRQLVGQGRIRLDDSLSRVPRKRAMVRSPA